MNQIEKREALKRERIRKLRVARTQETLLGYCLVPCVLLTVAGIYGVGFGIRRFLLFGITRELKQ